MQSDPLPQDVPTGDLEKTQGWTKLSKCLAQTAMCGNEGATALTEQDQHWVTHASGS